MYKNIILDTRHVVYIINEYFESLNTLIKEHFTKCINSQDIDQGNKTILILNTMKEYYLNKIESDNVTLILKQHHNLLDILKSIIDPLTIINYTNSKYEITQLCKDSVYTNILNYGRDYYNNETYLIPNILRINGYIDNIHKVNSSTIYNYMLEYHKTKTENPNKFIDICCESDKYELVKSIYNKDKIDYKKLFTNMKNYNWQYIEIVGELINHIKMDYLLIINQTFPTYIPSLYEIMPIEKEKYINEFINVCAPGVLIRLLIAINIFRKEHNLPVLNDKEINYNNLINRVYPLNVANLYKIIPTENIEYINKLLLKASSMCFIELLDQITDIKNIDFNLDLSHNYKQQLLTEYTLRV